MFDTFLEDLLQLAKSCDFCSGCEESLIRDRIIIGLKDADTIDKLLDEAGSTILMASVKECIKIKKKTFLIGLWWPSGLACQSIARLIARG